MKKKAFFFIATGLSVLTFSLWGAHFLSAQTGTTDGSFLTNATSPTETTTTTTNTTPTGETSLGIELADTIAPVMKLIGVSPIYIKAGSSYNDSGATAYDNIDGDISGRIVHESNVNTAIPGTYRVIYAVADRAGNKAHIERVVVVIANTTNIITATDSTTSTGSTSTSAVSSVPNGSPQTTTSNVETPTEIDRVLQVLRSENIQRIEAEKRRIIEEARKNTIQQSTSTKEISGEILKEATQARLAQETPEKIKEKIQKITERIATKPNETLLDSDHDGISDYDEKYIYGTDPHNPDTDGDGYSDGSEILGGYDPHDPDLQGAIAYENPQNAGEVKKDILTVSEISAVVPKKENIVEDKKDTAKIQLKGSGLPNSFVTIYIFSTPIVVTTRTDSEGNWEYVLDKELPDGNHEMYVAMTDGGGKILAKSNAIPFVKEAAAVTVNSAFLSPRTKGTPPGFFTGEYIYATAVVIFCIIGIILSIIGMRAQPYRYTVTPPRDEQHD